MKKDAVDLTITPELLGLSDVKIDGIRTSNDGSIHVKVSSIKTEILCRNCNRPTSPYGVGRLLCLRHLSSFGREVYIEVQPPRGKCQYCNDKPTTTQTLDWFTRNGHQTKPCEYYLLLQLIGSTLVDVAKKERIGVDKLQHVVDSNKTDEVDWKQIKKIGLLGIDEIAKLKGHGNYITLMTSRYQGVNKILGVLEGKKKATIAAFLRTIPKKKRKTISAVCVDMCDNYIDAVTEILSDNIPIVVDRFHVVKLYRKALDKLRSSELQRLRKELSDSEYKSLRPGIKILIAKKDCYSKEDKKILLSLFKHSPAMKAAYRLAREFTHIYNNHHRASSSERIINEWIEKVNVSKVTCLTEFAKTVNHYKEHINNYFINRDTSGWVEGINNKVKVIKRRCYGLTNLKHFFQRIFLDLQGYDIFLKKQHVNLVC